MALIADPYPVMDPQGSFVAELFGAVQARAFLKILNEVDPQPPGYRYKGRRGVTVYAGAYLHGEAAQGFCDVSKGLWSVRRTPMALRDVAPLWLSRGGG